MRKRKTPVVSHTFTHPEVVRFTYSVLDTWTPSGKPILFVPCSKNKPIQDSLTHRVMFHRFLAYCDLLIIAEPMTVIPYERRDYPHYEYTPFALWRIEGEYEDFKMRLSRFLKEKKLNDFKCYFLLPHHHLLVLWKSWERAFNDVSNLEGYGYTHATRWYFIKKLEQILYDDEKSM